MKYIVTAFAACLATAALSGCDASETSPQGGKTTAGQDASSPTEEKMPADSIIRADIEAPRPVERALQPLSVAIGFAEGGSALDDPAREKLDALMKSEQFMRGWPIVLRGHTDSTGSDVVNLRASRNRAEAVEAYLLDHGVNAERLKIIAMGEQWPLVPNAKPDGSPDEEGRARNRRVEVVVAPADDPADEGKSDETVTDNKDAS